MVAGGRRRARAGPRGALVACRAPHTPDDGRGRPVRAPRHRARTGRRRERPGHRRHERLRRRLLRAADRRGVPVCGAALRVRPDRVLGAAAPDRDGASAGRQGARSARPAVRRGHGVSVPRRRRHGTCWASTSCARRTTSGARRRCRPPPPIRRGSTRSPGGPAGSRRSWPRPRHRAPPPSRSAARSTASCRCRTSAGSAWASGGRSSRGRAGSSTGASRSGRAPWPIGRRTSSRGRSCLWGRVAVPAFDFRATTSDKMNIVAPTLMGCIRPGTYPLGWESGRLSPTGQYAWVYWVKRTCCVQL